MSAIYVQIGQCGNQVGQYFWKEALGILGNNRRKCEVKSAKHLEYGERLSSLLTYSEKLPLILLDHRCWSIYVGVSMVGQRG